jgi:hypothetical protein
MTTTLTWNDLVAAEPRLAVLLADARAVRDDRRRPSFCANAVWFGWHGDGGFKSQLRYLVGWGCRPDPILGTQAAYDLAYRTIYNALPDCRNCLCADRREYGL